MPPDRPRVEKRRDLAGVRRRNAEDHSVVFAAIPGEAAKGNKDPAAEQGERAALVLQPRIKTSAERRRHIDRPAGLDLFRR